MGNSDQAPPEYTEMVLCREFGWTPQELDQIDSQTVKCFLDMMNTEAQVRERKQKHEEAKHKSKHPSNRRR